MLGPKPAAGTVPIDEAALQSIREELDVASAAAKKEFKTGVRFASGAAVAMSCQAPCTTCELGDDSVV